MYRTHTCGELNIKNIGQTVTLSGWVQTIRNKGKMVWVDLRDRYGITQLVFEQGKTENIIWETLQSIGREYVIQASGRVIERYAKNPDLFTGAIEIAVTGLKILNASEIPPFTIEDNTDGGEELRSKYRYLDLRRPVMQKNIYLRYRITKLIRDYLDEQQFAEIETPYLIKSTPEGARDFIVPSRLHPGNFYALPQSPQTFKQLLMIAGYDRYFQIVRCFRDEDFRADRQPEFTQIDCEMSFVEQEDVLKVFEGLIKFLIHKITGKMLPDFTRLSYKQAMEKYGTDKPDMRFGLPITELTSIIKGHNFKIFDAAEYIGGIIIPGKSNISRKIIDSFTNYVKTPQVGASGMVDLKYYEDGSFKSSVDKFYTVEDWQHIATTIKMNRNDILLILSGDKEKTLVALGRLRLYLADYFKLISENDFSPLWITDFPLYEWDEETHRFNAMHHPFTAPLEEDVDMFETNPTAMRANAYDMVLNGMEIGGGSIRIHNAEIQRKMFKVLNLSDEEINDKFGFIINAFKYGAPPHGGIAFGLDRIVAILAKAPYIRDVIAFPKNNAGRDLMLDAPSQVGEEQLNELSLVIKKQNRK
ncbi:MAG TPA: aspartate--tRNA ligase [Bacteroidales bacterium]|nr:aspartate--tRNA ligase [Bacteroidales bacterium]